MNPEAVPERDPAVVALGYVGVFILAILVGGIAAGVGVEFLGGLRSGDRTVEQVRMAAVEGMMVGMGLSLPLVLVLQVLDARRRGPMTWPGWAVAGFILGVVTAGGLAWVKDSFR